MNSWTPRFGGVAGASRSKTSSAPLMSPRVARSAAQHDQRLGVMRLDLQRLLCVAERSGAVVAPQQDSGFERQRARLPLVQRQGIVDQFARFIAGIALQHQAGKLEPGLDVLGIVPDRGAKIGSHGRPVFIVLFDPRQRQPSGGHVVLEFDGVSQFERGPHVIAVGQELHAALVVALRALLRRAAAGGREKRSDQERVAEPDM